jgi:tetratricopeptide (TPR) repeat protein
VSQAPTWLEQTLIRVGPDLKNPFVYFYMGEANRGLALSTRNQSLRRSHYRNAMEAYKQGLAVFPQDENLLVRLAQVLDGLKLYDQAEEIYQKAFKADPNLGEIYIYYGDHLKLISKAQEAEESYRKGREMGATAIPTAGAAELAH